MLVVENVTFSYAEDSEILHGVSLALSPGTRCALIGSNGVGKSTLAQLAAGLLVPHEGRVLVDGLDSALARRADLARLVGYVGQDPRAQCVSSSVFEEVAFGPRNLGLTPDEVRRRTYEALERCGLTTQAKRTIYELSGGEQQRLAIASVLSMGCRYLVLDEITSQLDKSARVQVRSVIASLVAEGVGVLEVSHRAADIVGADTVVELCDTSLRHAPDDVLASMRGGRVYQTTLRQGIADRYRHTKIPDEQTRNGLRLSHVCAGYGTQRVLKDCTVVFPAGYLTLVVGPSGSGKTTLAQICAGMMSPESGDVLLCGERVTRGRVGIAYQRPEDQLFCNTVYEEVAFGPQNYGLDPQAVADRVSQALDVVGIDKSLWHVSPFELSGGQKRCVALADILARAPTAYVFDEPTAGLDVASATAVHELMCTLADEGAVVVVVTHDVDEWAPYADDMIELMSSPEIQVGSPGESEDKRSWLQQIDSRVQLVAVCALALSLWIAGPHGLLVGALLLGLLVVSTGTRLPSRLSLLVPVTLILCFSLLANAVVVDGTYDLSFWGNAGISWQGLARGARAVVRIGETVVLVLVLSSTLRASELADAVVRLMRPLTRTSSSFEDVSLVVALIFRLIPETVESIRRIRRAQEARGAQFDTGTLLRRLRRWTALLVPVIVRMFARSDEMAGSLRARAYTGVAMTDLSDGLRARDVGTLIIVGVLCAVIVLL